MLSVSSHSFLLMRFDDYIQPLDEGMDVYEKENYSTALNNWTHLAQQRDSSAQTVLGHISLKEESLPQNDEAAVEWDTRAATKGDERVGMLKDLVEEDMPPSQLQKAKELVEESVKIPIKAKFLPLPFDKFFNIISE